MLAKCCLKHFISPLQPFLKLALEALMGGRLCSQLSPSPPSACLGQHLTEECGSWGARAMIWEDRLEMLSSAQKAGLRICQYGGSRESAEFGSLYPLKGSILGPKMTRFRFSSKERLRGVWRKCQLLRKARSWCRGPHEKKGGVGVIPFR